MKRLSVITMGLLVVAFTFFGCALLPPGQTGWITLLDGTSLDNWDRIGDANWTLVEGGVQADKGGKAASYLVSKNSYTDFQLRAEFWVDPDANSGVFIRCSDPKKITSSNAYEANIFDKRPDPSYGTGGIPNVAQALVNLKTGGRWNTYEIYAKGSQLTVALNGVVTVHTQDSKFASGPIALQYGRGIVKFRKVEIKPL